MNRALIAILFIAISMGMLAGGAAHAKPDKKKKRAAAAVATAAAATAAQSVGVDGAAEAQLIKIYRLIGQAKTRQESG